MHEDGKQMLRQHIKRKRANEGLTDDFELEVFFTKQPRQELTKEEQELIMLRRQKNKEAAERSRKKKKSEMEKLQTENDQLNQDKCELVAMVQKLENDIKQFSDENYELRTNIDHLKRWIGKRCAELGLTGDTPNDLPPVKNVIKDLTPTSTPPSSTRGSPPPLPPLSYSLDPVKVDESGDYHSSFPQAVGMERAQMVPRAQLLTPWLVDEPVAEKQRITEPHTMAASLPEPYTATAKPFTQLSENHHHPVVMATKQQVVYLPKDAIIVIQDNHQATAVSAAAAMTAVPSVRPVVVTSPKLAVEPPSTMEMPYRRMSGSLDGKDAREMGHYFGEICTRASNVQVDTATVTAVEGLLRLG